MNVIVWPAIGEARSRVKLAVGGTFGGPLTVNVELAVVWAPLLSVTWRRTV